MIPPKPARFHVGGAPDGVEVKFITFLSDRPKMPDGARLQLIHTNAAPNESNVDGQWNWAHSAPNSNTIPHYQVDRDGRTRKMLPSDRRGIANSTVNSAEGSHGDVSWWSLAYETADTGTKNDPSISAFTEAQIQRLGEICAYESIVNPQISLVYPTAWHGPGTACHTEPFGYPYWTIHNGKTCPGSKKKAQVRDRILPLARQIRQAWTGSTPPPPPEDEVTEEQLREQLQVAAMQISAGAANNVMAQLKEYDLVGQMLNYPVPMPGGGTADLWSVIVDGRQRTMALQDTVAQLRTELATTQADLARLTDLADGPK
jgi:hypothetical protein